MPAQSPVQDHFPQNYVEVLDAIEPAVREQLPQLLKSVEEIWQPSELMPDLASEGWKEAAENFRDESSRSSEELMAVLVGNMVTEEALPSYQSWFNSLLVISDKNGTDQSAWAQWVRGWSAEEKRHGDVLSKYLFLSGRINMPAMERTIQNLIRNGFNPDTENDPYQGFVYTSFQERATNISHRNVSILAKRAGDDRLSEICGHIAGDEARHERAYKFFMGKVFEQDPSGAMAAFGKMMKKGISMPAKLMEDNVTPDLFTSYSATAQSIGVYTVLDYAGIIEHLISFWNVAYLTGLDSEAKKAQEYVCALPARYRKMSERMLAQKPKKVKFGWILDKNA